MPAVQKLDPAEADALIAEVREKNLHSDTAPLTCFSTEQIALFMVRAQIEWDRRTGRLPPYSPKRHGSTHAAYTHRED